ncbi:Alpha N-terminal protein methyltransferase 1 [Zalerion maritima]|uniref:Alpha N-terminal protein methyltransferase 1 n=1 Tax=Zalerion maritima TaxID=339359 RepID=A0AAD5RLT5_9PEZI|nr:Alpha N-terminal protein methyltransferase 1 [Zalerion maritima]
MLKETREESSSPTTSPPADSLINQEDGRKYWAGVDANVDGMLGGFPQISNIDLKGSRALLSRFGIGANRKGLAKAKRVLEGGAGIGRVTLGLLLDVSEKVDVIEPITTFTDALKGASGLGQVFNCGLEEWDPEPDDPYDVIWNQWCVGQLNDAQLVEYLRKCAAILTPDTGVIVVKENVSKQKDVFDPRDSSVTRRAYVGWVGGGGKYAPGVINGDTTSPSLKLATRLANPTLLSRSNEKFKAIFGEAGLRVVHQQVQNGLPPKYLGLYPIVMTPSTFDSPPASSCLITTNQHGSRLLDRLATLSALDATGFDTFVGEAEISAKKLGSEAAALPTAPGGAKAEWTTR